MKCRLLFISPGPKMRIDEKFYKKLGQYCDGTILTTSSVQEICETKTLSNFDFVCARYFFEYKLISSLWFFVFCMIFAIKKRLSGAKFDIVVTYDPIKTGVIGAIVSKVMGAKFAPQVNGVYTSDAEYLDGSETLSVRIKKVAIPAVTGWVLKQADGIKLLFDKQIDPFSKQIEGKVVTCFPNYVSADNFENLGEEKVILFVGFPFKRKGVDLLIKAFKKVADNHPEWKLKILGWFQNTAELTTAIDGHPQIFHHPPVQHAEMPKHLGSCAFLVLPSRSEAMGRVLVEATTCGKPRLGSNVDGIPTVINDGVDGLLFESENIDDLADKLNMLISDQSLRQRLGEAAMRRSKTEFTDEVYFGNLMSFYNKVLDR